MITIIRADLPGETLQQMARLTEEIRRGEASKRVDVARKAWRRSTVRRDVYLTIRAKLGDMAPGRERCMYCGDNQGTDVDHFDPLARRPLKTFDWLNHLLACSWCNSHQKRDEFPIDGGGNPLLIDPTVDDPFDHLFLSLSTGEYRGVTEKGDQTIRIFGLNRPLLTRGREHARASTVVALESWRIGHQSNDSAKVKTALFVVREQPFADVLQAMLRQATLPAAHELFKDIPDTLKLLLNPDLRAELII